jgi:putative membrane protein
MSPYSPHYDLHPSTLIGVVVLAGLYLYGMGPLRRSWSAPKPEWWRPICYFGALVVIVVSLNGPIHDLSDRYLFWVHMSQHLLLTLVMPPLLIAGLPGWFIDGLMTGRQDGKTARRQVFRLLTHPVFAGVFFSAVLLSWHTVGAYDLMMSNHDVHILTHLMFMVAAVLFWWPVVSASTALPRLGPGLGMLYLFLGQIPMQILGAIVTFADQPLYTWYQNAPRTWGISVLDDQKLGGLLMWVPGNMWIWGAMSVLFFQWAKKDGR